MTSNRTSEPRNTGNASIRTWLRAPFATRSERGTPTRPSVSHGHELPRYQQPPLV